MKAVSVLFLISLANGQQSTPDQTSSENVGAPPKLIPVYMGPFVEESLLDPASGLKAPIDFVEFGMVRPITEEAKRRMLKIAPIDEIELIEKKTRAPMYYNPRDKLLDEMQNETKEMSEPMRFNYEALQSMNLNSKPNYREPRYKYQTYNSKEVIDKLEPRQRAQDKTISVTDENKNSTLNWTTCAEFKKSKTKFHPQNLLDVNWLPFYTWSEGTTFDTSATIHKFRRAPIQTIVKIKRELGSRLTHNVDWTQPKLLMESNFDKILLIAVDQKGLFYGIKDVPIPEYFQRHKYLKFPVRLLHFKFVDQYLAMMNCEEKYATIMAALEKAPKTDADKEKAAKTLKFTGKGKPVSRNLEQEKIDEESEKILKLRLQEMKATNLKSEDVFGMKSDGHVRML